MMICRRFHNLLLFALVSASFLLTSCGASQSGVRAHRASKGGASQRYESPASFTIPPSADDPTRRLLTEARSWLGTSYKYGGEDASGVDCSGFVMSVFDRSLNIKLPRNSAKQEEYCRRIDRNDLSAGDLVFFTTRGSRGVGHVGIYIGDGRMIHSSSSRGVIITSLDQQYYVDNYYSSGRVDKFYAMKSAPSRRPSAVPEVVRPQEVFVADAAPEAEKPHAEPVKSAQHKPHTVRFTPSTPPPSTAAAMERDKQKALGQLLTQIEDSIFATK